MTRLTYTTRLILAFALSVLAVVFLSLSVGGGLVSSSTYAVAGALLIALAVVGFNTYRGGRATGSLGQLLYETEIGAPAGGRPVRTSVVNRSTR